MTHIHNTASWSLSSLGVALLVLSLVLMPTGGVNAAGSGFPCCGSHVGCSTSCGAGVYPTCGNGKCNKVPCCAYGRGCQCRLIIFPTGHGVCECTN